jgi:hypothetical protein
MLMHINAQSAPDSQVAQRLYAELSAQARAPGGLVVADADRIAKSPLRLVVKDYDFEEAGHGIVVRGRLAAVGMPGMDHGLTIAVRNEPEIVVAMATPGMRRDAGLSSPSLPKILHEKSGSDVELDSVYEGLEKFRTRRADMVKGGLTPR